MKEITKQELQSLFPEFKIDDTRYLGDYAIRKLQENPTLCPFSPPWKVSGGIGSLTCHQSGETIFSENGKTPIDLSLKFSQAIKTWVEKGAKVPNKEELERRRNLCLSCPFFKQPSFANGWLGRCGKCGCTMLKLYLETEHCPEGKW